MQNKVEEKNVFRNLAVNDSYSEAYDDEYLQFYKILLGDRYYQSGQKILDIGCGTGRQSIRLAKLGFNITGIDIASEAIHEAERKAEEESIEVRFIVGDAEATMFERDAFDICFCGGVLHHFNDLDSLSRELFRITKPRGMVCSFDPNALHLYSFFSHNVLNKFMKLHSFYQYFSPNERALKPEELETAFRSAGFTSFRFESMMLHTKKKKFKNIRTMGYACSSLLPGRLRKGNMLLMTCVKER